MKIRRTVVRGVLAAILALAFTACPGTNGVEPDTGSVAGTAVFADGKGGVAVTLTLEAADGQFSAFVVVTDEPGDGVSFRFDDVPPGNHALYASWQGAPERGLVRNLEVRAGVVFPLGNINITLSGCSCTQPVEAITIVSDGAGVTALVLAPGYSRILYARCPDGDILHNVLWFSTNPNVVSVQRPAGRFMMESGESVQVTVSAGATPGQTATIRATSMAGGDRLVEAALVVTVPMSTPPPFDGFVRVDGGTFQMGWCPVSPVTPIRNVTLSGFYMSRFQVTQGEWYDVMGTWPSHFTGTNASDDNWNWITVTPAFDRRNLPVENVSWYDAIVFSNRLSILRGLTPAYSIGGSTNPDDWGPVPTSRNATWDAVVMVPGSTGYRLPTEAQWEFAARGGIVCQGNFAFSGSDIADGVAWHYGNSGGRTHEVGTRQPNALGLYDMSGNVWEWVWDRFGTYPSVAETDPTGAVSGDFRVRRGGSWSDTPANARSVIRDELPPNNRVVVIGFRVVRP